MRDYVFDNSRLREAEQRFDALEALYDPITISHLEPVVVTGKRCLEVGGGSGSIARWMANRVGPSGRVVVTDINTHFLDAISASNVEVRQHNIVTDPLEEAAFGVAHTRLVLVHLPERVQVVEKLVAALEPGGWLVLQEFDSLSMPPDPSVVAGELRMKTLTTLWEVMKSRGVDIRFGRQLFPVLERLGLQEVAAEGHLVMHRGSLAGARILQANFEQMHDELIAAGLTQAQFDEDVRRLNQPDSYWPSQIMWTARGRKP